jgi:hypothetical protein
MPMEANLPLRGKTLWSNRNMEKKMEKLMTDLNI